MKKMRRLSLLLVFVLCFSMLSGCGDKKSDAKSGNETTTKKEEVKNEPKKGGTFVASIESEPQGYNPDAKPDDAAYIVVQNVFNKLVKINGKDQIVPDLAKSWDFSKDGKSITFHLQENVKWHDGKEFTSDDVKWTFDKIIKEKGFASQSISDIEEITCPDKNTVELKLKNANSGLLGYLAWFGTYIMPKHIYDGTDWLTNDANQKPIGTGPFKFVEHKKGESVTIQRNDEFWGDKAYLDKVVFKIIPDQNTAYQAWVSGETDETRNGVPSNELNKYEGNKDYAIYNKLWPNKTYIDFNVKTGKFADKKVRQAVAYGVNREEVFTKAVKGMGQKAEYFISPLYDWALDKDVKLPERDIKKAKSLLEEAGYKADANGIYFSATMDTYPGFEEVVEVLKANFKEFGIDLKVNAMDDAAYDEKVLNAQNFELTMLGGYQGPDISAIASRFGSKGPMNYGMYNNAKMDELLKKGVTLSSKEERATVYKEVQKILSEDLPAVFLTEKGAKLVVKSYVKGHPASDEVVDKTSEAEFTYVWLDK